MAHQTQRHFIALAAKHFPQFFAGCHVLEVGSLNINGTVRDFFTDCTYVGLDVAPGNGVDVVCQGQNYDAQDNSFDHVISCEAMEHNPYWLETFKNMVRLCKPGGLVLMTCATTGRREHGTSRTTPNDSPLTVGLEWNYYRNLTKSNFSRNFDLSGAFAMHRFWSNWSSYDLYFCGIKREPTISPYSQSSWNTFKSSLDDYIAAANNRKVCRYRQIIAKLFGDRWFTRMRALGKTLQYIHE